MPKHDLPKLILAFALLGQQARAAPSLFPAIMASLAAQPDRTARFTEEKRLSSLQQPLLSQGKLVFRHPAHLEKNTQSPRPEQMVIEGHMLTITVPNQPPRSIDLDDHPALRVLSTTIAAMLAGDAAEVRHFYTPQASGTLANWHVALHPITPEIARTVSLVTIDGSGADLQVMKIVQSNGDTQTLTVAKAP